MFSVLWTENCVYSPQRQVVNRSEFISDVVRWFWGMVCNLWMLVGWQSRHPGTLPELPPSPLAVLEAAARLSLLHQPCQSSLQAWRRWRWVL